MLTSTISRLSYTVAIRGISSPIMLRCARRLFSSRVTNGFPPLLKNYIERINPSLDFSRVALTGVGHLTPTNVMFIRLLMSRGLHQKNIFFQPKCYSIDQRSFKEASDLGIYISPRCNEFNPQKNYDEILEPASAETLQATISHLKALPSGEISHLILMDDGGYLTLRPELDDVPGSIQVVGTELTGNGIDKYKLPENQLKIPVIDQARSKLKTEIEMPIIVKTILPTLHKKVRYFRKLVPHERSPRVLIHGGGALGKALQKKIFGIYFTRIYDPIPHKSDYAVEEFEEALEWAEVHVVAHPKASLTDEQLAKLRNCMIFSISSGNHALGAHKLVQEHFKTHPFPNSCHEDVFTKNKVFIPNQNYPNNFTKDPQDYNWIDHHVTRLLQLAGNMQAVLATPTQKGIVPLNLKYARIASELWYENHGISY